MKKKSKNIKFPLAKVKKIIQKNELVGKIDRTIPFLISKSLEYFLNQMFEEMKTKFPDRSEKLTPSHL